MREVGRYRPRMPLLPLHATLALGATPYDPCTPTPAPDLTLHGLVAGSAFGSSVASAGDLDGDGDDELLVGAPTWTLDTAEPGRAYVFAGDPAGLGDAPAVEIVGDVPGGQ